ncbi:hypothetical protein [Deinococcus peraridilitoris]|uniref:hypothetical protein n=1 Tax=Deinococcus peraridilitoris TaxID=432329 RepID=UPI00031EDA67|nr:hypothetical protein [Deinococcus peraridilitoris]
MLSRELVLMDMEKAELHAPLFGGGRLLELHQPSLVPARTSVVAEVDASPAMIG